MRSKLARRNAATHALAVLVGVALGWAALPIWRQIVMAWNQDRYGLLVEQCDTAMRGQFQARATVASAPSPDAMRSLEQSEVGLLICQDYDLYQKRLLQWGLRENELAQMRLNAIEARATDLNDVIDIHEIRF